MKKYKKYSDKTKCMYFIIKMKKVFEKYMRIRENISNIIKKTFNSELIYNIKLYKS